MYLGTWPRSQGWLLSFSQSMGLWPFLLMGWLLGNVFGGGGGLVFLCSSSLGWGWLNHSPNHQAVPGWKTKGREATGLGDWTTWLHPLDPQWYSLSLSCFTVLGVEPRTWHTLGKHSITELHPSLTKELMNGEEFLSCKPALPPRSTPSYLSIHTHMYSEHRSYMCCVTWKRNDTYISF